MLKSKYTYIIFILVFITTSFIVYFALAFNPDAYLDTDGDGLTNYQEKAIYQTDWNNKDTDQDGYLDGIEVANNFSPRHKGLTMVAADSDNDGLNDDWEIKLGANLMVKDTDDDGITDGDEVLNDYSPTDPKPIKIKKKIEVSTTKLNLNFYFNDILLDTFPVSTGKPKTPTPLGEFKILAKIPVKNYNLYRNTKWNMHFTTQKGLRYYIHGAYWHNKFGKETVSGGCVNLRYVDMERLYKFTTLGTKVLVN